MAGKDIVVRFIAETEGLEAGSRRASKATEDVGSRFGRVQKAALVAGAAITGGLVMGLKSAVGAAREAEVSQARMETQLDALGISYEKHADQIEDVIQKTSKLAALDDEDLQEAFSRLVRATGDVNKALKDTSLAADIARGAGVSLEQATKALSMAEMGRVTSLKRLGVAVPEVNAEQAKLKAQIDAYKASHDKLSPAMKAHFDDLMATAKAQDKAATTTNAITEAQRKFGSAAEEYGKTGAAASERYSVAVENLQEAIGMGLLPITTALMNQAAGIANFLAEHETLTKVLVMTIGALGIALMVVSAATKIYVAGQTVATAATWAWNTALSANPIGIVVLALAAFGLALVVAYKKSETFRDIVEGALNAVKVVVGGVKGAFDKVVDVIEGVLGIFGAVKDWIGKNWETLIMTTLLGPVGFVISRFGLARDVLNDVRAVLQWLGTNFPKIWAAIKDAVSPIIGALVAVIQPLADVLGSVANGLRDIINLAEAAASALSKVGGLAGKGFGKVTSFFGGWRQYGGKVHTDMWYLTGERGPELFVPWTSGEIISAAQTAKFAHSWATVSETPAAGTSLIQNLIQPFTQAVETMASMSVPQVAPTIVMPTPGAPVIVQVTMAGPVFTRQKREIAEELALEIRDALLRAKRRGATLGLA